MNEEQLHAYVDNALGPEERRAVVAWLAAHPDDAERARCYAAQNAALHRAFDPVLTEAPGPAEASWRQRHQQRPEYRWALAAMLVLGLVLGATLRGVWITPASTVTIARQVALAHVAYVPEVRHPVEVAAAEQAHLVAWLSKRLDAPLRAPNLTSAGFQLLGGRLLPAAERGTDTPVALLMYENAQGKRLSLLVRREARNADTAFAFARDGDTNVFYWIDGPFGYALAGHVERTELQALARLAYQQLNP